MVMTALIIMYAIILWYIIILDLGYILLLLTSLRTIIYGYIEQDAIQVISLIRDYPMPPVTVIIPVYNGVDLVLDTIYAVLRSKEHKSIQLIIVNDGSKDNTLELLKDVFELQMIPPNTATIVPVRGQIKGLYYSSRVPNITVVDKEGGGKSDALNAALNVCKTDLFITLDHDTLVEPDAIFILVLNFLRKKGAVAVGGSLYILNGCVYKNGQLLEKNLSKNLLVAIQTCEYLRSFLYGRAGWDVIGGSLCYSGAFTLFELKAVLEVGGFDYKNVAQDFEIITHLHSYIKDQHFKSRLGFSPGAVAWTEVPSTLRSYWIQRTSWQMGSLQSLMEHKYLFFNKKYGVIGLVTYPFFLLGEMLAPLIVTTGYMLGIIAWFFGYVDYHWVLTILMVSVGLSLSVSVSTILISFITYDKYKNIRAKLWMLFAVILENFGFRQFLAICEAYATIKFFLGYRPLRYTFR